MGAALLLVMLHILFREINGKDIFVSKMPGSGEAKTCGNLTQPCSTMSFAINYIARENDVIMLDNSGEFQSKFIEQKTIIVRRSMAIRSRYVNKPRAVVATKKHAAVFYMHCRKPCHFEVSGINMSSLYAGIYLPSGFTGQLKIHDALIDSKVSIFGRPLTKNNTITVTVDIQNVIAKAIRISGNVTFFASDSVFEVHKLFMTLEPVSNTDILSVKFQNVLFQNGTFSSESPAPDNRKLSSSSNVIEFTNCTFKEFQLTVRYGYKVKIVDSSFLANTQTLSENKQQYVAYIQAYQVIDVIIDSSIFRNSRFGAISLANCNKVTILRSLFINNKKDIEEGQGGGAILSHFSDVKIDACEFLNNSAIRGGGTLHNIGGKLTVQNTAISTNDNSPLNSAVFCQSRGSWQNVSLTITKPGREKRTVLTLLPFNNDFKYMGTWDIINEGLSIVCPRNHRLESFSELSPYSNVSNRFTDFTTTCKQCQKGTYSFDQGQQYLKTVANKSLVYKHNITCWDCAAEATCDSEEIVSKGNYWGYRSGNVVKFIPCPTYYCCSRHTTPCISFNSCSRNREGNICGVCRKGYSEDIFSTTCLPTEECSRGAAAFWFVYILCSFVVTMFLMYMKDLFKIAKQCCCFKQKSQLPINEILSVPLLGDGASVDNDKEDSDTEVVAVESGSEGVALGYVYNEVPCDESNNAENIQEGHKFFGFFKILVQFYQIASLLRVISPSKDIVTALETNPVIDFIMSFFSIKIVSTTDRLRALSTCPISHMTAIRKEFVLASFPLSLVLSVGIFYLASMLLTRLPPYFKKRPAYFKLTEEGYSKPFTVRLKSCLVQIVLLSYVTVSLFLLEMVNCLQINGKKLLYIQGNVACYQDWQILITIFIFTWMVPFSFTMYISSQMLSKKLLTPNEFLVTLVCPPYILFRILKPREILENLTTVDIQTKQNFLLILSGPFRKTTTSKNQYHLFWESTLVIRRILLTVVYVFVVHPVIKSYVMLFLLLLYLIHHCYMSPYSSRILNISETLSLMLLNLLCGLNLYWAYSNTIDTESMAHHADIAETFVYLEVFIVIAPLMVLVIYLIFGALKSLAKTCTKY